MVLSKALSKYQRNYQKILILISALIFVGCVQQSAISIDQQNLNVPENWQQTFNKNEQLKKNASESMEFSITNDWLSPLITPQLQTYINKALNNNYQLQQQKYNLLALQQSAISVGSTLWPSLSLNLTSNRRKNVSPDDYRSNHDLSASLRYELDIWGKLDANDQQINLTLASQTSLFEQAKQQLVIDVISSWYKVVENKQQLNLNQQRLNNAEENLAIIESGYNAGLNSSLDVYLARTEVANEKARVSKQNTLLASVTRQLESILGEYPASALAVDDKALPNTKNMLAQQLPSEVVANNLSLQASWYSLLAKDAGLAYAHKQRFPSISLTANISSISSEFSDLLSQDIGWSLIGNITQPIFNAGRLKANEEKARLETKQAEQAYLAQLNRVFANIENSLTQESNLTDIFQANKMATENAELAEKLAFEQYVKGLVDYVTVLGAQSRAFNAKSSLLQTKYQIIENRLQLHLSLGGNFNALISEENL